jgi:hypothetical protein
MMRCQPGYVTLFPRHPQTLAFFHLSCYNCNITHDELIGRRDASQVLSSKRFFCAIK